MTGPAASPASTLRAAKALIERYGWTQGANNYGGFPVVWGGVTPHEAIVRVVAPYQAQAIEFLAAAIDQPGAGSCGIVEWNGAHNRAIDQVYAAFDRAIILAEGRVEG